MLAIVAASLYQASAQSINFVGASKRAVKQQLKEYGFEIEKKTDLISRITAISAYNEDAGAFGLYIFINGVCMEAYISFFGQDENYWWEVLEGPLFQINDYTWIDQLNKQLYILYFDETLGQWTIKITPY